LTDLLKHVDATSAVNNDLKAPIFLLLTTASMSTFVEFLEALADTLQRTVVSWARCMDDLFEVADELAATEKVKLLSLQTGNLPGELK